MTKVNPFLMLGLKLEVARAAMTNFYRSQV